MFKGFPQRRGVVSSPCARTTSGCTVAQCDAAAPVVAAAAGRNLVKTTNPFIRVQLSRPSGSWPCWTPAVIKQ